MSDINAVGGSAAPAGGTDLQATNDNQNWGEAQPYNYARYDENNMDHEWEGNAQVYEYAGEDGEIGPEIPALEIQLFGEPERRGFTAGIDFSKCVDIYRLEVVMS